MLTEVFKNSLRAVVEHHGEGGFDDWLPPVRCRIVHGCEDVTLKISDEGGGISRSRERDIWKFMYSTYKKSPWASQKGIASPPGGDWEHVVRHRLECQRLHNLFHRFRLSCSIRVRQDVCLCLPEHL